MRGNTPVTLPAYPSGLKSYCCSPRSLTRSLTGLLSGFSYEHTSLLLQVLQVLLHCPECSSSDICLARSSLSQGSSQMSLISKAFPDQAILNNNNPHRARRRADPADDGRALRRGHARDAAARRRSARPALRQIGRASCRERV